MQHITDRDVLVAGLRALANDIEHSDIPLPTHTIEARWLIFTSGGSYPQRVADQKAATAQIVAGLGGKWDKGKRHSGGDLFDFVKDYGGGVHAEVVVDREEVCERVVVGTETVTIPATEEATVPAQPERVEEHEVVEWRCAPLLANVEVSS